MTSPFQVLSLSGGGARGVFQAKLLALATSRSKRSLSESFNLIAATSTGALVALAIASGRSPETVVRLYEEHGQHIFREKRVGILRRGGRFDNEPLYKILRKEFGNLRMSDLETKVLIATSVVNTYEGRFFTEQDSDVNVVDVAMATSAAPTYFPPANVEGQARGFMDGGLWANDPSFLAIQHCQSVLNVDYRQVALLSIGTGRVQTGKSPAVVREQRTLSAGTVRFIYDFISNLQSWSAEYSCQQLLGPTQMLRINPHLQNWIPLDDHKLANDTLPAIAETEYEKHEPEILSFLHRSRSIDFEILPELSPLLRQGLIEANVTRFMPSRRYYALFRGGRESIGSYVATAQVTLTMVSINLATGNDIEQIIDTFETLVARPVPVSIRLSLLDPTRMHLMESIAPVLGLTAPELASRISEVIKRLGQFKAGLSASSQRHFEVWCHNAIPNASAILIDEATESGVIQLETKAYKASLLNSFGFEVSHGSEFYDTLQKAYNRLISDGTKII